MNRSLLIISTGLPGTLLPLLQYARSLGYSSASTRVLTGPQQTAALQNLGYALVKEFDYEAFEAVAGSQAFSVANWTYQKTVKAYAQQLPAILQNLQPDLILTDHFQIHVPVLAHAAGIRCHVLGSIVNIFPIQLHAPLFCFEDAASLNDKYSLLLSALEAIKALDPLLPPMDLRSYPRVPLFGDRYLLRTDAEHTGLVQLPEPFAYAGACLPDADLVAGFYGPQRSWGRVRSEQRLIYFEDHKHLPDDRIKDLIELVRQGDNRLVFLSPRAALRDAELEDPERFAAAPAYPYQNLAESDFMISAGHPTAAAHGMRHGIFHIVLSSGSGTHFTARLLENIGLGRLLFSTGDDATELPQLFAETCHRG